MKRLRSPHKFSIAAVLASNIALISQSGQTSELLDQSFFIRLGAGLTALENTSFHDRDCNAVLPPALFGCSDGPDGKRIGVYGDFEKGVVIEAAGGLQVNEWLKTEIALIYRPHLDFSGQ